MTLGARGRFLAFPLWFLAEKGCFSILGKLQFLLSPLWILGIDGVFAIWGKWLFSSFFPLWFPGFRIATEIFVTLGALGRFLALPL